jgi:hypothetical protein
MKILEKFNALIYHFIASLKDLGKNWYAFSKMMNEGLVLLEKVCLN